MNRKILWPILVIGALLIVMPFAFGMPGKTNAGARMMNDFEPLMAPANVQTTADYYYKTFVPLRAVVPAVSKENVARFQGYLQGIQGMQADAQKLVPTLAQAMQMTPAQVQQFMGQQFPAMSRMLQSLPQMQKDFGGLLGVMSKNVDVFARVPAGLDHYKPLVDTMQNNVNDYKQANSLPSFRLFPWFFVVPGILLVLLAGWGLVQGRRPSETAVARRTPAGGTG